MKKPKNWTYADRLGLPREMHPAEDEYPKLYPGSDSGVLTAAMDNVLAGRLSDVALKMQDPELKIGDSIDRGLILRRLLDEAGFELRQK